MLKASDFSKGDAAYVLIYWTKHKASVEEVKVVDVFKEYVVVDFPWVFKFSDWNAEFHDGRFLYEVGEIDEPSLLFKEKEEAEKYLEKIKIAAWLGAMSFAKAKDFSLEQLQKVKEILDENRSSRRQNDVRNNQSRYSGRTTSEHIKEKRKGNCPGRGTDSYYK